MDIFFVISAPSNVSNLSMRRRRPQMTLSFGVDTTQKTLMFATESPFLLNDCQDIDPNLPLDRQEYVISVPFFRAHCISFYCAFLSNLDGTTEVLAKRRPWTCFATKKKALI